MPLNHYQQLQARGVRVGHAHVAQQWSPHTKPSPMTQAFSMYFGSGMAEGWYGRMWECSRSTVTELTGDEAMNSENSAKKGTVSA